MDHFVVFSAIFYILYPQFYQITVYNLQLAVWASMLILEVNSYSGSFFFLNIMIVKYSEPECLGVRILHVSF